MNLLIPESDVERWFVAGQLDPVKATRIAVAELRLRADAGDTEAKTVLEAWLHGGARQDLKSAFRAKDQMLTVSHDLQLARRFSVRRSDGSRQLVAWDAMTRPEFDSVVTEYKAQARKRNRTIRIFDRVTKAWDADASLSTAEDAFRAAGIDVTTVRVAA